MGLAHDWRLGVRMFIRQPGLSAAAVLALALGVGLTTFLFSLGYGIFLRGLPLPDGRRVMAVTTANVATGRQERSVSVHDFADWRASQRSFEDLGAFRYASLDVAVGEGRLERLGGAVVTANTFELLHAQPLYGRTFVTADGEAGAPPVLVLGYGAWITHFGGDPHVVGRPVRANGVLATIVGVMPRGFGFPQSENAWMVLRADPLQYPRGRGPSLVVFGRLETGVSRRRAQSDLTAIAARLAREHPDTNRGFTPVVSLYTEEMSGADEARDNMVQTMALAFGVLLMACANVANLLFARAAARTREMAVRTALGASRQRLIAQMLLETAVLASAGSLVGLGIAYAGTRAFTWAIANMTPPFWVKIQIDLPALAVAAGLTVVSAVVAGAIPAWRASRANVNERLLDNSRAGGLRIGRLSRALITAEIAISFALLVMAGLMIRSIVNVGAHEYGFPMRDVLTTRLVLPESRYPDAASRERFAGALLDRVAALPGVQSATTASALPGLPAADSRVAIAGRAYRDASEFPVVRRAAIGPRFFETFDRHLVKGRAFVASDDGAAAKVAIVNASFAARFLPGVDPVGSRIRLGRDEASPWLTVVGVAPDLCMSGAEDREPAGVYVPLAQSEEPAIGLAVRVSAPAAATAAAIRAQIAALDRDLSLATVRNLREAVNASMWAYFVFGPLLVAVGLPALFLATVGLYSLMAFAMRQRVREIGLRMALGARPLDVARLIAGQVSWEVGAGLLGGAALGWVVARLMRASLFHVQPDDPATYAVIVGTLVAAAALAAWVPVRRAIRVDPTVALRAE